MIDELSRAESKPRKSRDAVKIAALFGAVLGALMARPVIRPWLEAHGPGLSLKDWPLHFSLVPWVVFSLYWEIQSKNSTPAVSSESKASRAVHVVLANLALFLIVLPSRSLSQRFLPDALIVKLIGFGVECAGVALAIWARRLLGGNWSGEITIKENHELIRSGPYRTLRHPIYSALLAMYLGTAVISGQAHALAGLVLAIFAYLRKTRMEEANLVNAFGERYEEYREQTWAIVPGLY
jgi:protein-S-isoprenylcysteine O-methyltransferase Ste14